MQFTKNQGDPRVAKEQCPLKVLIGVNHIKIIGALLLSQLAFNSFAQLRSPQPDAGSIYKQIEQGLKLPTPSLGEERKPAEVSKEASPSELRVTVTKFNILGNSLLSEVQIDEVVKPFLGKALTFDDLQKVVQILIEQYRQSGWVVRAYLPKQEVGNGEIVIQVVEAKFGGVTLENSGKRRISEARMLAMVEAAQPKEKFIRSSSVDRVLLLMDDVPGVGVTGNLVEGREEGHTDLLLNVVEKPLVNGFASVDNSGSASTGPNKLSTSVSLNSLLGLGDQLQASIVRTTGSTFARLAFTAPVGYDGMRAGVHYSNMNYQLVGSFANLAATGSVRDAGLDATKNLDSSEKIYLGGANGVRAYPTNEGGGAGGQTATLELRNRLDENWSWIGFYDYGKIFQYQKNSDSNNNTLAVNSPNNYELQGYGMTVQWKSISGTDIKATVAKRLGTNPAASLATGMDSDGTYRNPHIWVSASVPF